MVNSKDNLGNELTKEQIEYFKNSKIRDDNGNLLVCYHGSPNPDFKEFDPRNQKSQFGKYKFGQHNVNYFSTDKRSAASYTQFGYDDGTVFECYINITNPYIVDNKTEAEMKSSFNIKDDKLRQRQITLFDRLFNKWKDKIIDMSDYRFNNLNSDLRTLNLELRPSDKYDSDTDPEDIDLFDLYDLGKNSFFGAEHPIFYQYYTDELFSDDMYEELKNEIIGEDPNDYYFSTDDVVRYVLSLEDNYDGIIIKDIHDSKEMFSLSATDVITLSSSNQIKLISNKQPTRSQKINEDIEDIYDDEFLNDLIDTYENEELPEIYPDFDLSNKDDIDIDKQEKERINTIRKQNKGKTYNIPKDIIQLWKDEPERYDWLKNYDIKTLDLDEFIKVNKLTDKDHGMFHRRADRWGINPELYYYNKNKEDWLYSPIRVTNDLRAIDGGHRLYALWNNGYKYAEVLMPKQLNESLLLEVSRRQLIDKSKRGKAYKDQSKGKNRWERRKWSRVANTTKSFNSIDMNKFFKKDTLIVDIPVQGETDNYVVKIKFNGVLEEINRLVEKNNNVLDYRIISQALSTVFNSENVYINCNCMDFQIRFNHYSTIYNYSSGKPEDRPNRFTWTNSENNMGSACKHGNLVLANLSWLMKVASVINNYIHFAETNMQRQFADIIFPKIYGVKYPEAVQLGLFDRQYLKHSKGVIDAINDFGSNRGKFKKTKPTTTQASEIKVEQEPKQLSLFDKEVKQPQGFKKDTIFDYGVEDTTIEQPKEKKGFKTPTIQPKGFKQLSIFDEEESE